MFEDLSREEKIALVRKSLTKVYMPQLFDELVQGGGSSVIYSAGTGINISDDHEISVVIGDLIDSGDIVVGADGTITLSDEIKTKLQTIPTITEGDSIAKISDVKDIIGKFWKTYTPDTPPIVDDGSIFVIVPENVQTFNGKTESENNPDKIYFDSRNNVIWTNGIKYGSSSSSGSWELDADEKVLYLSDNHILASDLKFECIEEDGNKYLQLTGKNNISLGRYQLNEYQEPLVFSPYMDDPRVIHLPEITEDGSPVERIGDNKYSTYMRWYTSDRERKDSILDIKNWFPNITNEDDLWSTDSTLVSKDIVLDGETSLKGYFEGSTFYIDVYFKSDWHNWIYHQDKAGTPIDNRGFIEIIARFQFATPREQIEIEHGTSKILTNVELRYTDSLEVESAIGEGFDHMTSSERIIDNMYKLNQVSGVVNQLVESFKTIPTSDNPIVTLEDLKSSENVKSAVKDIVETELSDFDPWGSYE